MPKKGYATMTIDKENENGMFNAIYVSNDNSKKVELYYSILADILTSGMKPKHVNELGMYYQYCRSEVWNAILFYAYNEVLSRFSMDAGIAIYRDTGFFEKTHSDNYWLYHDKAEEAKKTLALYAYYEAEALALMHKVAKLYQYQCLFDDEPTPYTRKAIWCVDQQMLNK